MTAIGILQVGVIAVLAGAVGAKILSQRRRGIRPVALGKAEDGLLARLEPFALATLFLWFGAIALHGTGWTPRFFEPRLFRYSVLEAAGALLTVSALALLITALRHMGRSWRIGIDAQSREHLITRGVFAISRNPIYLAIDLIALGVFLISGSVLFLVSGVLVLAGIHVQILREERFLGVAFGDEYGRYRSRVHRYLGRRKVRIPLGAGRQPNLRTVSAGPAEPARRNQHLTIPDHTAMVARMSKTLLAPQADRFDPLPPERSHVASDFAADTSGCFPHFLGLQLEEVRYDYARMRLPFRAELNQPGGVLHGGAIATLIDTVVVPAISSAYEKKPVLFTVNFQVHFLAPVQGEDAVAEGWVEKRGGSTVFCRAEVRSASGELASTGSLIYKVIPRA